MLHAFISFIFPDACVFCGGSLPLEQRHLCCSCRAGIRPAVRLVSLADGPVSDDRTTQSTEIMYLFSFDGPVRALVHSLKYGGRTSAASVLARLAQPVIASLAAAPLDAIVAVPLHPVRLRERGFNQSLLVAAALARLVGIPVLDGLDRTRPTRPQTGLSRHERIRNVARAFRARAARVRGRHILLLDDVVTTGATLAAAGDALVAAGAASVLATAIAGRVAREAGPEDPPAADPNRSGGPAPREAGKRLTPRSRG